MKDTKLLRPLTSDWIMVCWIAAVTLVAIFGPAWVAVLMFCVVAGGPSAAHALAKKMGLADWD